MFVARHGGAFSCELVEAREGFALLKVGGKGAGEAWKDEAGGHRVQRVPENEKRGRVHSSTITVAVMREPTPTELQLEDRDLEWTTCRGSGPGGQARNKIESAVQVKHKPTGVSVRCESERSQHQNRQTALSLLRTKLHAAAQEAQNAAEAATRRAQVGCGARGDKRRTIRFQDEQVNDHITGQRWRLKDYLRGEF